MRSLRVVVGEQPADYRQLRERYRNAYDDWDSRTLERLQASAGRGITVAQLAVQTGRPPEHLASMARELEYELLEDGPDTQNVYPSVSENYLVHVGRPPGSGSGSGPPRTVDVLARSKIQPEDVYRLGWWGFAANLSEREANQLAADPVSVRRTSRPLTVAARAGVVPARIFYSSNSFAADLTDEQLAAVRRDPEVDRVDDDSYIRAG